MCMYVYIYNYIYGLYGSDYRICALLPSLTLSPVNVIDPRLDI